MAKPPEKSLEKTSPPDADDELTQEIVKRVGNLVPAGQRTQIVAQMVSLVTEERFSGPIPHPRHMREYEDICPGSADRLIMMAEQSLAHAQEIQRSALDGDIHDTKAGRIYGLVALIALIVAATFAMYTDHEVAAAAFLGAGVLGVVGQLIQGQKQDKSEKD